MARMSIDDKVGRDPRITLLALALGWSKRELVGCLVLDVWPLCYDQESALVSERIIDAAAGHTGFAAAMVEAELATRDRSGKLRITGAAKRIAYLDHQKKAGREGGLKSAEMRAKESKGKPRVREASLNRASSDGQGSGNPSVPDTVPDSASAPDAAPDSVPDGVTQREDTEPPARPKHKGAKDHTEPSGASGDRKARLPADWTPARSEVNIEAERVAAARGVDIQAELKSMRDWATANASKKVDWDATWRNWTRNSRPQNVRRQTGGEVLDHLLRMAGEQP